MCDQANLFRHHEANVIFAPEVKRPLPVVVLTGFLGSGKTTLLGRLLENRANLRIAAVAHDLATINVDAHFLASGTSRDRADAATSDGAVVALGGCACCSDFETEVKAMVKTSLLDGIDQDNIDYLVLETSGAADPRRLVTVLDQQFGACTRARLDRVVAVADAEQISGDECSAEDGLLRAQLSCADVVVLNKIDLVDEAGMRAAEKRLAVICPQANVLPCSYGAVSIADILEVSEAGKAKLASGVSHEKAQACWVVAQDLEPKQRPSASNTSASFLPMSEHRDSHRTVEWSCADRPICLARLQNLLAFQLPRWRAVLKRGKGVLWLAQDPRARWEWQSSGRLRYSSRRDEEGFAGAAAWTGIVLIFVADVSAEILASAQKALENLAVAQDPGPACALISEMRECKVKEATQALRSCKPAFEILRLPREPDPCLAPVICFRLTGREHFGIPEDVDLETQPYGVDIDGLNVELARMVSIAQGGSLLWSGIGLDRCDQPVVGMLAPLDEVCVDEASPPSPAIFAPLLEVAASEAVALLKKYFAHVQSCRCGQ